jgi:hypothetical protein
MPIDRSAPEWQSLKEHFTGRLNVLRNQLEAPNTPEGTADLRGRIAEIREFMRAVEPESDPVEATPSYV